MVFRTFDKLLFAKSESTPGTAATITTANDFFEVIEPSFSITPLMFERFTKSQTLTPQTQTVPGASKAAPVATCEITFGVELAGPGTAVATGTVPKVDTLLKACGMVASNVFKYAVSATSYSGGPFFHQESVDNADPWAAGDNTSWSCNTYGDAEFWARAAGSSATVLTGEHSEADLTLSASAATQFGVGYYPSTSKTSPTAANTAVTLRLYVGGGAYVEAKGCKGTFDIAFTHGDRAVINFTFTGVLASYTESGSTPVDHSYTAELPPAFLNASLKVGDDTAMVAYYAGALFNSIGLSSGNEVTVREDTNDATGYQAAVITGRTPTMSFNPDAVIGSTDHDFWGNFLSGTPMRMRWSVGSTAGNRVDFRVTSGQFTGIADGERDTVSVLDSTTTLTGGTFGSSIIPAQGTPSGSTFGSDNEWFMVFR
jgi:hypothetical protein